MRESATAEIKTGNVHLVATIPRRMRESAVSQGAPRHNGPRRMRESAAAEIKTGNVHLVAMIPRRMRESAAAEI